MGQIRPVIGITADVAEDRLQSSRAYSDAVAAAGGVPLILPPMPSIVADVLDCCDGIILSGGGDPIMEHWGVPTHPAATTIHPDRQAFELAILEALDDLPHTPLLGICLGMQLMGLHAGGVLDQFLPDTLVTHADHWGRKPHKIAGELIDGRVLSNHRQALRDAGRLQVIATAPDGVIEAIRDEQRPFYLGVQWHPERTDDARFGAELFSRLVEAARKAI